MAQTLEGFIERLRITGLGPANRYFDSDLINSLFTLFPAVTDGAIAPTLEQLNDNPLLQVAIVAKHIQDNPTCPDCPPCPPDPPLEGLDWGPDNTTIAKLVYDVGAGFPYNDPTITSLTFHSLQTITGDVEISGGFGFIGMQQVRAPLLQTVGGSVFITQLSGTVVIEFDSLVSVDTSFLINDCNVLASLDFPELVQITNSGSLNFGSNTGLTEILLPSFVSAPGSFSADSCASLVTLSVPSYVPTNGTTQSFSNCALNAASVNAFLARCVANAGFVSGIVDLSGGTSSAPTGQGIADKATLIGRGCTVTTN
jgi:hypothetical protein